MSDIVPPEKVREIIRLAERIHRDPKWSAYHRPACHCAGCAKKAGAWR